MSTQTATDLSAARAAAEALAEMLPSSVPLTVADAPAERPAPDATAVIASYVGATSVDLVVVADTAVAEALAGAPDVTVSLADALRPSLEAAAQTFGAGVLDVAATEPVGRRLEEEDVHVFALAGADGPQAWVGVRIRAGVTPAPDVPRQKRAPADERANLRLLYDVEMTLTAEIGRTRLPVRQVLELVPGSVLELDRAAGAPADLMVNGRLIARGEVVVVDEDYGLRITEIVSSPEASA